jgi:hypothetical protein
MVGVVAAYLMVIGGIYSAAIGIWWDQGRAIDERLFGAFRRWLSRQSEEHRMGYQLGLWMERQRWYRPFCFVIGIASACVGAILLGWV